jgi:hypothetical protein
MGFSDSILGINRIGCVAPRHPAGWDSYDDCYGFDLACIAKSTLREFCIAGLVSRNMLAPSATKPRNIPVNTIDCGNEAAIELAQGSVSPDRP